MRKDLTIILFKSDPLFDEFSIGLVTNFFSWVEILQ